MAGNQKNSIITFVENPNSQDARFEGDEIVFSIPYSKILEATRFCERERLDSVYLGLKNDTWQTEISSRSFKYFVIVTKDGLSAETTERYIYAITPAPSF